MSIIKFKSLTGIPTPDGQGLPIPGKDGCYFFMVEFEDRCGHKHEWYPKWSDLRDVFVEAAYLELNNSNGGRKNISEILAFFESARFVADDLESAVRENCASGKT
jgi:hypothetical protein